MFELRWQTPEEWVQRVKSEPVAFLQDHAANERKVAVAAVNLASEHPQRPELVAELISLAREELEHFQRVFELLRARGATLAWDAPHPYIGRLRKAARHPDVEQYLLNRLLVFGLIEARACERFRLLAEGLDDPELRRFYTELAAAEARHHGFYLGLARRSFDTELVRSRHAELLELEAEVARSLPLRAALY